MGAAILYGLHQVFTKLAADRIGDGLGGFVVEATAALTILLYLAALWLGGVESNVQLARRVVFRAYGRFALGLEQSFSSCFSKRAARCLPCQWCWRAARR